MLVAFRVLAGGEEDVDDMEQHDFQPWEEELEPFLVELNNRSLGPGDYAS